METPYQPLTEDYQMSDAQLKFHRAFPDREIDCDWPISGYDIDKVIEEINKSSFLMNAKNLSLRSCLKHYNYIVSGGYRDSRDLVLGQKQLQAQKMMQDMYFDTPSDSALKRITEEELTKASYLKTPRTNEEWSEEARRDLAAHII